MDTRLMTEAQRTEAVKEQNRQLQAADWETARQDVAREREAVRQDRWRFKFPRKLQPD